MDIGEVMAGLHGLSIVIGAIVGFIGAMLLSRLDRRRILNQVADNLSAEVKQSFETVTETIQTSVKTTSSEALKDNQAQFLTVANEKLADQRNLHSQELESKKELIDTQLNQMSETLKTVPTALEKNEEKVGEVLRQSTNSLKESNETYLKQVDDKTLSQTKAHIAELEAKKKLIDQHLEQMSKTLKTVPTELEKNQRNVSEVIEKSAKGLEESNVAHLELLQERSDTQSKKHIAKLDEKELLINRRLGEMDDKLGKVQTLIEEFEKARESKLGALDDQLKSLTATTSSLQSALADSRARGRWGEEIAKSLLENLGYIKGIDFETQAAGLSDGRPDFRFRLPNRQTLNMDVKFPLDNYRKFHDASSESDKEAFRKAFLSDVRRHVESVERRDYINAETVDCALIFIPIERIVSFVYEQDETIILGALQKKIIICSPLTLYSVLAVIHQASESFAFAERSRELFALLGEIRNEWKSHTEQMDKLEGNFKRVQNNFLRLRDSRIVDLDSKFERLSEVQKRTQLAESNDGDKSLPPLKEST